MSALQAGFLDPMMLLFWVLILYAFVNPWLHQKALENARKGMIRILERKLGMRVITMVHRQDRISFFGIPVYRFIDIEDSEEVLRAIRETPPERGIALILHTPGGMVLAAEQIARALKHHGGRKVVIVPHYAMSGGTLIALAADEIWMDPSAVLGPLDPQLSSTKYGSVPAPSVLRAVEKKGVDKVSDETLILADVAEKALRQVKGFVKELIADKLGEGRAEEVADVLTRGEWTHDYPLTADFMRSLGLPVKTELPPEVYELMKLYPQAMPHRPGIEYLPTPPFGGRGE